MVIKLTEEEAAKLLRELSKRIFASGQQLGSIERSIRADAREIMELCRLYEENAVAYLEDACEVVIADPRKANSASLGAADTLLEKAWRGKTD